MIISHKHKFIFIKTVKTAGTSIEIALSKFCGEEDIITPIGVKDEAVRQSLGYPGPQNYQLPPAMAAIEWPDAPPGLNRTCHYNHAPAFVIQRRIERTIWDSYFKFSVDRNPYDRAISLYYWNMRDVAEKLSLREFFRRLNPAMLSNYNLYSIRGTLAVDHLMRYEDLDQELARIAEHVGISEMLEIPRVKAHTRIDKRPYQEVFREFLGDDEKKLIDNSCAREIALLGYAFEGRI